MNRKHPNVINITEVEPRVESRGAKFGYTARRVGPHVGAKSIGCSLIEIEPGRQAFPHHFHCANEETVYVLEGSGTVRIGADSVEIAAGDYIAFPVGPEHAHSIRNTSNARLKLLCFSTLIPVEVVGYPDSGKTAAVAIADASKGFMGGTSPWVRMIVKNGASVDYYEGEEG